MKVEKIDNGDGTTTYKFVTIEKQDALACKDLEPIVKHGVIEWNHDANDILGEPEAIYLEDNLLLADMRIYHEQLAKSRNVSIKEVFNFIEACIPSIAGVIISQNEDGSIKELRVTNVALGLNNVDPTIERISAQMKHE